MAERQRDPSPRHLPSNMSRSSSIDEQLNQRLLDNEEPSLHPLHATATPSQAEAILQDESREGQSSAIATRRRQIHNRRSVAATSIQFHSHRLHHRSHEAHGNTRLAYNTRSWSATFAMWGHLVRGRFFVGPWILLTLFSVVCVLPWRRFLPEWLLTGFDEFAIPTEVPIAVGATMSLLLAFRLNVSYARWWEARELWGGITSGSRSLLTALIAAAHAADIATRRMATTAAPGATGGAHGRASWEGSFGAAEEAAAARHRQLLLRQVAGWNIGVAVALFHHLRGDPPETFATFPGDTRESVLEHGMDIDREEGLEAAEEASLPSPPPSPPSLRASVNRGGGGGGGGGWPNGSLQGSPTMARTFLGSGSGTPPPRHHCGGTHDGLYTLLSREQLGAMAKSQHPPLYALGRLREATGGRRRGDGRRVGAAASASRAPEAGGSGPRSAPRCSEPRRRPARLLHTCCLPVCSLGAAAADGQVRRLSLSLGSSSPRARDPQAVEASLCHHFDTSERSGRSSWLLA